MAKMTMDDLDNSERTKQLEMIDQLRELGVGEDISLPQVNLTTLPLEYERG